MKIAYRQTPSFLTAARGFLLLYVIRCLIESYNSNAITFTYATSLVAPAFFYIVYLYRKKYPYLIITDSTIKKNIYRKEISWNNVIGINTNNKIFIIETESKKMKIHTDEIESYSLDILTRILNKRLAILKTK